MLRLQSADTGQPHFSVPVFPDAFETHARKQGFLNPACDWISSRHLPVFRTASFLFGRETF
jgi:hypothetical protein